MMGTSLYLPVVILLMQCKWKMESVHSKKLLLSVPFYLLF